MDTFPHRFEESLIWRQTMPYYQLATATCRKKVWDLNFWNERQELCLSI